MKRIVLYILMLILLLACNKNDNYKRDNYEKKIINGIETILNENVPSIKKFNIELALDFELPGIIENGDSIELLFTNPANIEFDDYQNIYINDCYGTAGSVSISIFNNKGVFLKKIIKKGIGPDEVSYFGGFFLSQDTLFYSNYGTGIKMFNIDGNFIKNFEYSSDTRQLIFENSKIENIDRIIVYRSDIKYTEKNKLQVIFYLDLYDLDMIKIKELKRTSIECSNQDFIATVLDIYRKFAYTSDGKVIYIAEKSISDYKIDVYNLEGEIKYSFMKTANKVSLDSEERKHFKLFGIKNMKYKELIRSLNIDKYGNLWVEKSIESCREKELKVKYDIFQKGVFLNSLEINTIKKNGDLIPFNYFKIFKDKIYIADRENNKVKVYSYDYKIIE